MTIETSIASIVEGETFRDACAASDAELLAIAFERLPKLLQTGNSLLIPEYASDFWNRQVSVGVDSLNSYEYLAASACLGTNHQHDVTALRGCLARPRAV